MRVSIITVCFNEAERIEDTIKSVISQNYSDIEYIIVDGSSTDGTVNIVNGYRERVARIVSEADEGTYDAMNKGIKLATGDVALHFGLSHPAIVSIALNTSKPHKMNRNVEILEREVPCAFWKDMKEKGLIDPDYKYL